MIRCTIGVMAHNEEQMIPHVLHALLAQEPTSCTILEIVVVASGCTDHTVEFAQAVARNNPQIRVIAEAERSGKAQAINQLLNVARGDVVVLVGADTLPEQNAIDELVRPFSDPTVGMTGAQVVPLNDPTTFMGLTVHVLWRMHHEMARRWPKLGELVAFRNVIDALPVDTAVDEVALEAMLTERGYRLVYTPAAIVYNLGPSTLADFVNQRRRIFAGHVEMVRSHNYVAASMPGRRMVQLVGAALRTYPERIPAVCGAMALEGLARLAGKLDSISRYSHRIWKPIRSTKAIQSTRPLRILMIQLQSADQSATLAAAYAVPKGLGQVHWWDAEQGTLIYRLPADADETVLLAMIQALPDVHIVAAHVLNIAGSAPIIDEHARGGTAGVVTMNSRVMRRLHPLPMLESGD
jgi:poly-beta-1,6-N-acetyl-D-glucosamine synthase